jgi:hypothetical protein
LFEQLAGSIGSAFSDLLPTDFCLPCFLEGFAQGAAVGLLAGALTVAGLAALAALAPAAATFAAITLAVVGVAGVIAALANMKNLNDKEKSRAWGELLGGAVGAIGGGGLAGKAVAGSSMPALSFELAAGSEAMLAPVVSSAVIPAATAGQIGAGAAVGAGGAMMMSGEGGGSDHSDVTRPSQQPDPSHTPGGTHKKLSKRDTDKSNKITNQGEADAASILAKEGYVIKHVGGSRPDFLIEGREFECKTPTSSDLRNIIDNNISTTVSKIKASTGKPQADRVVLNLQHTSVTPAQIKQSLIASPVDGLTELIAIDKSGRVIRLWP